MSQAARQQKERLKQQKIKMMNMEADGKSRGSTASAKKRPRSALPACSMLPVPTVMATVPVVHACESVVHVPCTIVPEGEGGVNVIRAVASQVLYYV